MGLYNPGEIELNDPPVFQMEEKVRLRKMIRNDGTFPGKELGQTLAKKGDVGYIVSIGTYLQSYYIYAVHFIDSGFVVGCRYKELESAEDPQTLERRKAEMSSY
ncbi:nitrogen fixation protein NifZ [cyanobacterium endosymbiont of Epithemia turgida]|uniref:nitrogen fixation protein NifZ n=1 Tax=cyanobacterium endosymbiont of Epithemia turgida TaxID=718217 RepID=UPI0004D0BA6B|nr:nitrogen fixation protein NifZ [cyanobacterium endosymbiont of Epithemia turgida]BAP18219.1 iron-sulfur cofactor synthesis protein [cyanobacterium endosymbiont of Epithemia turgida isolate EtSB Lake Yunoko]